MATFISAAVGLILTGLVLLQQIALWQRKEYRRDRLQAEFFSPGQKPIIAWVISVAILIALLGIFMYSASNFVWADRLGWVGLGAITLGYLYQTHVRGFFRPQPTAKAGFIVVASVILIIVSATVLLRIFPSALGWYLIILCTPVVVFLAVGIGNGVGEIQKRLLISQVTAMREQLSSLKVIGITGSFGKTSTKYFVHHLLSGTVPTTVMSAHRRNEVFAVAQDMKQNLTPETTVYVAEMGAYRRHEIERLAHLAKPTIGVVTAIRNQHVALFGSLEALAAAKWELIENLPADGIAVLNADDPTIQQKAATHSGKIVWYSTKKHAEVWADNIICESTSSSFTLHLDQTAQNVTIPLPGEGYVSAAVAAAATAYAIGTPPSTIFERLASLPTVPQTMIVTTNSRGTTIIDDSYSANEEGVLMALRHLQRFPQAKKIVVLRPLIELGGDTERVHVAIGKALAKAQAALYLYDTPGAVDVESAAKAAGLTQPIHRIGSPKALAQTLNDVLEADTVCLLENRLPDIVRNAVLG